MLAPSLQTQMMEHAAEPVLDISMQQLPEAETGTSDIIIGPLPLAHSCYGLDGTWHLLKHERMVPILHSLKLPA